MLKETIPNHILEIEQKFGKSGNIYIYKGFPTEWYLEICQLFPRVIDLNIFQGNYILSLEVINQSARSYMKALLDADPASNFSMLYEEFQTFSKDVSPDLFQFNFIIITNNLFKLYPNQSNHLTSDVESAIDNNGNINEDNIFDVFYSNSVVVDEKFYIQYLDAEVERWKQVKNHNYFQSDNYPDLLTKPYNENSSSSINELIRFQPNDPQYLHLKYQVFFGQVIDSINILIDENGFLFHKDELKILQHLFSKTDSTCVFFYRKDSYDNSHRPELLNILKEYWSADAFRNLRFYKDPDISSELIELSQGAICEHIVKQTELALKLLVFEDIFLTAPTGAGKSVLFQVPAIYLAEKYNLVTIIISPLKALMQDQVSSLKYERKYLNVACINSDLSFIERDQIINGIKNGSISIVYVSPELLQSYDISHFIGERKIGLMVIDEAHLVTTWGRDFRVDYWFLGNFIRKIRKNRQMLFPVLAVTATAVYTGLNDMVFDTIGSVNMQNCRKYIGYVKRDDISFSITNFILPTKNHEKDKIVKTSQVIQQYIQDEIKAIAYFPWKNTIDDVIKVLSPSDQNFVGRYYSNVEIAERHRVIKDFKSGAIKVVLASKAFGMGIDIPDIKEVYHHAPSGTIADYVQEIGRAARKTGMLGIARTDFHKNDLKFTKILFGLSSLKQFQVKLVLEKLYNIYKLYKHRNFLVSVDDFAYIFSDEKNDPEQKIKSALLVLEKDMLAKYDYPVLVVRPKSIFSTVYARVNNEDKEKFLAKYKEFVQEEPITARGSAVRIINKNTTAIPPQQTKTSVFRIELNRLWENHFAEESFPTIKYRFFKKELFSEIGDINPQLKLSILFNQPIGATLIELTNNFQKIENAIKAFSTRYFSEEELTDALKLQFYDEIMVKNAVNLLLAFYTDINTFGAQGRNSHIGHFIQKRFNPSTKQNEYRILNSAFPIVKHQSRSKFQQLFSGIKSSNPSYINFISANPDNSIEKIRLIYIMELFGLCTFELSGGEKPQIFIRINDPLKIERLSKSKYTNSIITSIKRKHERNIQIMQHFFTTKMTDMERWEFIENYFLGKDMETLIPEIEIEIIG